MLTNELNPSFYEHRNAQYFSLPLYIFNNEYKKDHHESIIEQHLHKNVKNRYFQVPEFVFKEFAKGNLSEVCVWILLTCFYLLHINKRNGFSEGEILQLVMEARKKTCSYPSLKKCFKHCVAELKRSGWIEQKNRLIFLKIF
ncbi:hypothetical protein [Aeribacillus pallidus]|uniref:Uncharacterized protein n=1 Tax=Aeribacillus pallidus TaxID=33936 RepID=A0A223E711_9BACI|nr:hypothetical protein [Aeribacillus pallidus]ASS91067.1 hypothetical protein AP3564_13300 [Aeribacillus pallidus]